MKSERFEDFLLGQGYEPDLPLDDSGRIVRFRGPDERRNKSAWYWYVGEAGVLGDWRNGLKAHWFNKDKLREDQKEKRKECIERLHQKSVERYARERSDRERARETAEKMWTNALETNMQDYLLRKGVGSCGTRVYRHKVLLVPLYNSKGELVNLQRIFPDGAKRFLKGGEVEGCYFKIGTGTASYICEGFATGATIHHVTRRSVVCAMNCGNLMNVALLFRRSKPMIAADNDHRTVINGELVNPGLNHAMEVSRQLKLPLVFPVYSVSAGTDTVVDFNDLMKEAGEKETRKQLRSSVRLAK
jgi:putative DNA primase/helicase